MWSASTGTWSWVTSPNGFAVAHNVQWGSASSMDARFLRDIDGDGKADLIVWRPGPGTWYWLSASSGYSYAASKAKQWGSGGQGDTPLMGDIDGDGKADLVVWRPGTGTWFWLTSSTGYNYGAAGARQWGSATAQRVPEMVR